ncbi:unnamed protein product [Orchesella dallaii]|uniref:Uncharacterized protein n=1 Tax=Orchesella dallaii TaxID=48710 RepID=A0ABP1PNA4_9HEXA
MGKPELNMNSNETPSHDHLSSLHTKKSFDTTRKSKLEDVASGPRASAVSVNNSMQELVAFDPDGHPYIDINKLSYKPRKKHHDHQKENFSWYAPDFGFIVFNFMSLGCSTYFILIGNTTLTWKASIGMFSLPSCYAIHGYNFTNGTRVPSTSTSRNKPDDFFYAPCEIFLHEDPFWDSSQQIPHEGYNFSIPGSHPILRTKLTDAHYFGLVLICISLLNIMNTCVGINACLHGYKNILYAHIAVDGLVVLIEFVICAAVHFTGRCEEKDIEIIRVLLRHFVQWYGLVQKPAELESAREKLLTNEIDSLQIGLGCCGADGWQDYLASSGNYPQSNLAPKTDLDETESVIPFSCCRPWWIRNIYCAHGAHRWGHPMASAAKAFQFHERINQESCVYKLEKMCYKIKSLMGGQGFITTFFHMGFIIIESLAVFILVRNINNLIKEKKRMMRKKEISREADDSGDEFEAMDEDADETSHYRTPVDDSMMTARTSGDSATTRGTGTASFQKSRGIFTKLPPPTEDEIVMIKQRTNFNQFITKVKTSHVGRWMKEAREKVTAGHEDEDEQLTAAEKKTREKELLHKVKNKGDDDSDEAIRVHHHHHQHGTGKHMSVAMLEKLAEVGEEQKEMMRPRRSSSRKRGKHVTMNKVKSKLSVGHIFKRKSHPKMKGGEDFDDKMTPHVSEGEQEQQKSLTALASKYGKKKHRKHRRRLVPIPSTPSLVLLHPGKKTGKHPHKEKHVGKTESSTAMLHQEEGEQETEAEVEVDKKPVLPEKTSSKQKVNIARDQAEPSSSEWESENTDTGGEGGSEEEEDSDEHKRRKRKKRKRSRKKKIKAARKRREKHKRNEKRPWFAYF